MEGSRKSKLILECSVINNLTVEEDETEKRYDKNEYQQREEKVHKSNVGRSLIKLS